MIVGTVNTRCEAIVALCVRGPSGIELVIDAVLDSGFTGSLTLPLAEVTALGLIRQSGGSAILADGSTRPFDIFAAEVEWEGAWRPVLVSAVGDEALMGMRLLAGHLLSVEVTPGGRVEITALH